jgi:preprotein translocase subunit SecY
VLYLPQLLTAVLPSGEGQWGRDVQDWVDGNLVRSDHPVYLIFYGLLIVGFAYFYTAIAFDPVKQADNIRKQGGFIPGIRPGQQTEKYLSRILNRITLAGAFFIAGVALIPTAVIGHVVGGGNSGAFAFGGTSILIAVGVALETMKQIDSQLMMRNYEGFLK